MKPVYTCLFLGILAFALYANTLTHGFVLDDEVVITRNTFVQKGFSGISEIVSNDSFSGYDRVGAGKSVLEGGRYRPLSLVLFAVIYQFSGPNPMPFHVMAVLSYVVLVLLVYKMLQSMLRDIPAGNRIAFFTAILFAVHPIHTEVVNNIKGIDETLALLFGVLSMHAMLQAHDTRKRNWISISVIAMFLAGMAKEGAVAIAIAGPMALWFFRQVTVKQLILKSLPMVAGASLYVILRFVVLGNMEQLNMAVDPLNNAFVKWQGNAWVPFSGAERFGTIAFVCWKYLQLLVFPFPLTHDYYPFVIEAHNFSDAPDWIGIIVMTGLLVGGLWCLRNRVPIGFSLLFYVLTLIVSLNLFFPIGTFMAERFVFTPSLGFCLGAVSLAVLWKPQWSRRMNWVLAPAIVILSLFAILTVLRNRDWKDNLALYKADLRTSAKSVKLNHDYGSMKLTQALATQDAERRKGLIDTAYKHMIAATENHPSYYDAHVGLGASAFYKGDFEKSVFGYQRAIALFPRDSNSMMGLHHALQGLATDLTNAQQYDKAIEALRVAQQIYPDTAISRRIMEIEEIQIK